MLKPGKAFHVNVTTLLACPLPAIAAVVGAIGALYRCIFGDDRDDELLTDQKFRNPLAIEIWESRSS